MNRKHLLALALLTLSLLVLSGCGSSGGVTIHTSTLINGLDYPDPGVSVGGQVIANVNPIGGAVTSFGYVAGCFGCFAQTNGNGNYSTGPNLNMGSNTLWDFERGGDVFNPDPSCFTRVTAIPKNGDQIPLQCVLFGPFLSVTPNTIDVSQPLPATITLSGPTLSAQFGMPPVRIYDEFGNLIASTTAFAIASDGSSIQISTPPALASLYSGEYGAIVGQIRSDGSAAPVSGGSFFITGNDPPPPPPPPDGGGCGGGTAMQLDCT